MVKKASPFFSSFLCALCVEALLTQGQNPLTQRTQRAWRNSTEKNGESEAVLFIQSAQDVQ